MKEKDIDKIKIPSNLDDVIENAIEEGYKRRNRSEMKNKWKKRGVAVAATVIIGTTAFGVAFPTYAKDIPIIGNIFEYLSENKNGSYTGYKDYSKTLDMVQESNDIKFTLNDAIYDGTTVMVTYTMESKEDLGEQITVRDDLSIKGYKGGMAGSSGVYKVRDNTYIGFTRMSIDQVKDQLDVELIVDSVKDFEDLDIKGDWKFKFNLKKTDTDIMIANKSVEKEGINLNIEKITFTPMSTIIHYSQQASDEALGEYHSIYTELVEVKDDLGNVYVGEGNGGSGTKALMNWTSTYEKIDKNATKLIITPKVEFSVLGEDGHRMIGPSILKSDNPEKEVLDYLKEKGIMPKEMILDDIIIDLK